MSSGLTYVWQCVAVSNSLLRKEYWTNGNVNIAVKIPWKYKLFPCSQTESGISIFNPTVASLKKKGQASWQISCQLWGWVYPQHTFHWNTCTHILQYTTHWKSSSSMARDGWVEARGQVPLSLCPTFVTMKHILVASTQGSWWRGRYKDFIHLLWPVTNR